MKFVAFAVVLSAANCLADVRLPRILGSSMVLQREADVTIWGWADSGEEIRVKCDWIPDIAATKADADGNWQVRIRTGASGGPHAMVVTGNNTIRLEEILFGEVWIGSGQSNMEMPLVNVSGAYTGVKDSAREVAGANYPEIRLFQVGNFSSRGPLDDVETGITMYGVPPSSCRWTACSPDSISTFSSTAYFFARELHEQLDIPIGIIDASWGGTSAEAWTPTSGLAALGYESDLEKATSLPQQADQKIPARLYNGMIHPLRRTVVKGFVWYQGEGNVGRADRYTRLFSTMIGQWREAFQAELPFYFVQIAPFSYQGKNAAFLREAQLETLTVPRTGMVVTSDIGNLKDIHPKNKQEVGRRLALWALARDYGFDVVPSGPIFRSVRFSESVAHLEFDHVGGGLATPNGTPPTEFQIAGPDRVFHPATARIVRHEVHVLSDKVPKPVAVRYAFSSQAMPNLMNREGLPASPFRTDRW